MADSSPVQRDIVIDKGSTFTLAIHSNLDLTGAAVTGKGRASHGATDPVFSWTAGDFTLVVAGNHTDITLTMSATATAALTAPQYGVYDIEYSLAGVVDRIAEGTFYVTPEATR